MVSLSACVSRFGTITTVQGVPCFVFSTDAARPLSYPDSKQADRYLGTVDLMDTEADGRVERQIVDALLKQVDATLAHLDDSPLTDLLMVYLRSLDIGVIPPIAPYNPGSVDQTQYPRYY